MTGPPRRARRPRLRQRISPGRAGGPDAGVGHHTGEAAADRPGARAAAVFGAARNPVVLILLAIAFFTSISGKPVDGVLMLTVAVALAWDHARAALGRAPGAELPAARVPVASRRRVLVVAALVVGGAAYAAVVGSFIRYSWPATAGIVALGTVVVLLGWHGPLRIRPAENLPAVGTAAWAVAGIAGCLWELATLLMQPDLTTGSYAHPTISTLTDPLLAGWPGRSVVLAAWLALGWFLAER